MRRLLWTTCLAACIFGLVISPAAAKKKADREELRATLRSLSDELVQATLEDDWEKVFSYYTDDAVSMPNYGALLDGKQAIIEYYEGMRAGGVEFHAMEFNTLDVWACGDLVYETGTFEVSLTVPAMPSGLTDHGKYMTVWKQDRRGSLKVKAEIWNSDENPWDGVRGPASEEGEGEYRRLLEAKNTLQRMADSLRRRGMIGVDGEWDDTRGGYRIETFAEGSTAPKAGVRVGDLLVKVNGIPLSDRESTAADMKNRGPDREATLTVERDGVDHEMTVTFIPMTEKIVAEEIGRFVLQNYLE